MSNCSIVTISKVVVGKDKIEINSKESVEYSKIYNSLINNPKIGMYIDSKNDENQTESILIGMCEDLAKDIVEQCLSVIDDISIEVEYDQPINQLTIKINLLLTKSDQLLNAKFYDISFSLSEKYERFVIENDLTDSLSIDCDVMLKNEYTKYITIKEVSK